MNEKKLEDKITEIIKERCHLMITASWHNLLDDDTYEDHARNMAKAILAEVKDNPCV